MTAVFADRGGDADARNLGGKGRVETGFVAEIRALSAPAISFLGGARRPSGLKKVEAGIRPARGEQ